jgi:hypothetical protein
MFNLEQSIGEWRRQMVAGGIKSPEVLDELESHLREDVEQRVRSGANAARAFAEAIGQIGPVDKLKLEFGKVSLPQPRIRRSALRAYCLGTAVFVFLIEGWTLLEYEVTRTERFLGLALVVAIAGYIGFLPDLNRKLRTGVRGWTFRNRLGYLCGGLVVLWVCALYLSLAHVILLPSEIVFNVVCWALITAAAMTLVVFAYGTEPETLDLWTPEAWQSFEIASAEASHFHHDFIGTEHVLLGLLGAESGSVANVLRKMGVSRETVRTEIEKIVGDGPRVETARKQPYTPRANRALKLALQEARALRCHRVDSEHVFLGLLREGSGVAARVLIELGVSTAKAREEILRQGAE